MTEQEESIMDVGGTEERPVYFKVAHDDGWVTQLYMIVCNEGWRESIVATSMYEWAADWLIEVIGRRPYPQPDRKNDHERGVEKNPRLQ